MEGRGEPFSLAADLSITGHGLTSHSQSTLIKELTQISCLPGESAWPANKPPRPG